MRLFRGNITNLKVTKTRIRESFGTNDEWEIRWAFSDFRGDWIVDTDRFFVVVDIFTMFIAQFGNV